MGNNNTGLGLIKTTIERVQNEKSLFVSALKKLVNSTEEELKDFLKKTILSLISFGQTIVLKSLNGQRTIAKAEKIFKSYIDPDFGNWGLNKPGKATVETPVQVHEMIGDGNFMDIFSSLPGTWEQKWLSQDQIIEFCETHPEWLHQDGNETFFLGKKDETKPVDEENPNGNLVVVIVRVYSDGLCVSVSQLENDYVWSAEDRPWVVAPQLVPLTV